MSTREPLTVRPLGPEGVAAMLRVVDGAFGEESPPDAIASWVRVLEPGRTFTINDGDVVVGGGSIYSFQLSVPGGRLPAGGLTAVGILPSHRRRGGLNGLMRRVFDDGIARAEPLSVLWAAEGPIYGRYGYGVAALRCTVTAPRQHIAFAPPLPDRGRIRLLAPDDALRLLPAVWERAAAITPGFLARSDAWWSTQVLDDAEWRRGGAGMRFIPAFERDGRIEGYAFYRMRTEWDHLGPHNTLEVRELVAPDPEAELALWRFLFEMDLVSTVKAQVVPVDTPLFLRVTDPRRLAMTVGDGLWLRILDVPAAVAGRTWAADGALTLEVRDPLVPSVEGRWRLTAQGGHAAAERTQARPDVTLGVAELSSLYLGGVRATDLARAGRIEAADPGALALLDALLATARRPWCPAIF